MAVKWASALGMALLTAYAAHPFLTTVLLVAEDPDAQTRSNFTALMLGGLCVVFALALVVLLRQPNPRMRVEKGCLWSGALLWLTVPVMVLIVWMTAAAENGADHGSATAAFFMLLIFGGYCAIFGTVLLGVSYVMRKRRIAAQGAPLRR